MSTDSRLFSDLPPLRMLRAALLRAGADGSIVSGRDPAPLWLLTGLLTALLPHLLRMPVQLSVLCLLLLGWRLRHEWAHTSLPGRGLRLLLTAVALGVIYLSYHTFIGRHAGVALLVVMLCLKLLEMRSARDHLLVIFLGYFVVVTAFLFDQSSLLALYLLLVVVLLTTALIAGHYSRLPRATGAAMQLGPLASLRLARNLVLQALPLMLVLFVLFPRIDGPLWGMPKDAFSARTGLSDTLSPGNITRLSDNNAVAFRVHFDGPLPPPAQRYWRGPVLWDFDGTTWSDPQRAIELRGSPAHLELVPTGPALHYELTLEPHNRHWLFALDLPASVPPRATLTRSGELLTRHPVTAVQRFKLTSYPDYRLAPDQPPPGGRYLVLPQHGASQARALARRWRARAGNDRDVVRLALAYFRQQPFYYTREPPLTPSDPVDSFLFDTRRGYCEHYASAFAVLMRAAGIPSRVVTGYQGGELNPLGDYLIVRQSDAHAWDEVWLAGQGWVRIDPTAVIPANRIDNATDLARLQPQARPLSEAPGWLASAWRDLGYRWDSLSYYWNQWVIGYNEKRQRDLLSWLGLDGTDWRSLAGLLFAFVAGLVGVFAFALLWHRPVQQDPARRLWLRFTRKLARHGLVCAPHEGAADFARRIARQRPDLASAAAAIASLYNRIRYATGADNPARPPLLIELRRRIHRFRP